MVLFDGEDMSTIKGKDNSGSNASALLSVDLEKKDKEYVLSLRLNYGDQRRWQWQRFCNVSLVVCLVRVHIKLNN